jgi:ATP-dependent phosphofructokinase / diphosphate-dependent phosphofructokinase
MSAGNLLVIQGGGPTPVFNTSLVSIVEEGLKQSRIGKILGARSGMKGLSSGDIVNLTSSAHADLASIANSPGAALGSSRFKPTDEDLERCVQHLKDLEIRYLIFMGGNGTMRGAQAFGQFCDNAHFEVQIIGVPKTIDNDIAATDRCPGFGSAARFVAQSTLDLSMDLRSLPQPVSIFETLGRDVGWLAASATLARRRPDDAPQLVYIPEIPFSTSAFLADLDAVVSRLGCALVVVSEGIVDADGTPVFEQIIASRTGTPNRPLIGGVAQYLSGVVAEQLGIRCRSEKPGLIGRSSMAHVSEQDRSDAAIVGREGVRALMAGATNKMVTLLPLSAQAANACDLVQLSTPASFNRRIPDHWLIKGADTVTQDFVEYVRPIVGQLSHYNSFL